jgi:hypothetical protein
MFFYVVLFGSSAFHRPPPQLRHRLYPHLLFLSLGLSSLCAEPTYADKKRNKIFLIYSIKKFRMEQLQSHIWLTASSYWSNICAFPRILGNPSSYMTLQLLHSNFPLYMRKFLLSFYQCILASFNIILLLRSTQSTLITYSQQYVVHLRVYSINKVSRFIKI